MCPATPSTPLPPDLLMGGTGARKATRKRVGPTSERWKERVMVRLAKMRQLMPSHQQLQNEMQRQREVDNRVALGRPRRARTEIPERGHKPRCRVQPLVPILEEGEDTFALGHLAEYLIGGVQRRVDQHFAFVLLVHG
ncbi:unnamed protein product [Polarella glacialis]|uniref:Uncharacterized protein n=1 Tax=Polarella glacialis TaxID=89957 RepID=A0A813HBE2_POLGL|nr:unnamed protein product [Polarella glacialis]